MFEKGLINDMFDDVKNKNKNKNKIIQMENPKT